jgi:serine/threonine protein kinase
VTFEELETGERIGTGGNADVQLAQTPSGDTVAIKSPRFTDTIDKEVFDELLSEARRWNRVDDHNHIVSVIDWGEATGRPWIAMEYMDSGHLGQRMDNVDISEAMRVVRAIADAVVHAHRRGIAHLDLKPQNVLFRETEEAVPDVPKVADWGLSHALAEQPNSVSGLSPQYAAPEQFDPAEYGPVGQKTDIYQLGVTAFELVTGELPYGDQPTQVTRGVLNEAVPVPSDVDSAIPDAASEIIRKALATDPADRYEHIIYFRDDLNALFGE